MELLDRVPNFVIIHSIEHFHAKEF
jgi:hypothetical protein